jgi:UPF0271 protein
MTNEEPDLGTRLRIDLNADVGESFGVYALGQDEALVANVTSVNVACGFHAGDPSVMRRTVRLAVASGAAIGAHPGFPDLQGFGRREVTMAPSEVEDLVLYQIAALAGVAAAEGGRLSHVKPHGALYNMAARDPALAAAVVAAVAALDPALRIVAPPASALSAAAAGRGLATAAEAFADRAYRPDGSLVPRTEAGAVGHDAGAVSARALRLVEAGEVVAIDGSVLALRPDTICVHGDTPRAAALAAELRRRLTAAGVRVAPLGAV